MKPLAHRKRIIEATARILANEPDISNLVLLQRLAGEVGAAVVSEVPVNRVRRQVREPALEFLRTGMIPPAPAEAMRSARVRKVADAGGGRDGSAKAPRERERAPSGERVEPKTRRPRRRLRAEVEKAILEAFTLGLEASDRGETVEAFRQVTELQERVLRSVE